MVCFRGCSAVSGQSGPLAGLAESTCFSYRYDYRNQWLGFTAALAVAGSNLEPGNVVIGRLGDLVESPADGWVAEGSGRFHLQRD